MRWNSHRIWELHWSKKELKVSYPGTQTNRREWVEAHFKQGDQASFATGLSEFVHVTKELRALPWWTNYKTICLNCSILKCLASICQVEARNLTWLAVYCGREVKFTTYWDFNIRDGLYNWFSNVFYFHKGEKKSKP